jgi:hypothetical protein
MIKKWIPVLIILLIVLYGCDKQKSTPPPSTPSTPEAIIIPNVLAYSLDDTAIFNTDLQPDQIEMIAQHPLTDIYHIEADLSDDLTSLSGRMQIRYFNRMPDNLEEVYFRLLPNLWGNLMQVNAVTVSDNPVTPILENRDTALKVPLRDGIASGGYIDINLDFEVTIPQDASGNYGIFGNQYGTLALAQFYPLIPLRDERGWRIETYPPVGDITVAEVANYLVRFSAPEGFKIAASGVQISNEIKGGRQVITQVASLSREFYVAGNSFFQEQTLTDMGIKYTIYSLQDGMPAAKEALGYMEAAVNVFSQRYGVYPYRELECVATPTNALGVEYPGIIAINQVLLIPLANIGEISASALIEGTVVHEVAHEWFYNIVGNDQGREPWLDEALAQYMTYQYFMDIYGASAADSFNQSWWSRWDRVQRESIPIGLPVESYEGREYSAIIYGRGPLFLEQLSLAMGQVIFDQFLKDYFSSYSWKVATTKDFQSLAEETCGCNLEPLFNEWVHMK